MKGDTERRKDERNLSTVRIEISVTNIRRVKSRSVKNDSTVR